MSTTKTIPLAQATLEEMKWFAVNELKMKKPHPNIKEENLRAQIAAQWDKTDIFVSGEVVGTNPTEGDGGGATVKPTAAKASDTPMVTLEIAKEETKEGSLPVFVSVNGRAMWIPRGEEVTIKYPYYEALKHAERTVWDQEGEGAEATMVSRKVKAYPFQVIRMPPQEEIDAWLGKAAA